MSDKNISEEVKGLTRDAELAPIVDGVQKIADHVVKHEQRVNERVDGIHKEVTREIQDLGTKMEKGFEDVADRFERQAKIRQTGALGALRFEDVTEPLVAAANDDDKALFRRMEPITRQYKQDLGADAYLGKPEVAGALQKWLQASTKLQLGKFRAKHDQIAQEFNKWDRAFQDMVSKASLQEDTTTEGGNLVPTIVQSEILRQVLDSALIFSRIRQIPMTVNTHSLPSETTAVTVNWVNEEGTLTAGEPVFGAVTLGGKKLAGRATMSIELVEDSNVAVLPYLLGVFTEKMGRELDFQTMEGTTPFTGVNTAASVNVVAATATTAGDNLTYPKLVDIFVAGGEAASRGDGVWVMSPAIYGKLLGLVDSNGQPIVKLGTVETAPQGMLLGRPIIVHNALGSFTVGSDATGNIYFGPPRSLIAGTRTGFRWEVTDQVSWATYQMDARLVGRFAFVVGVAADWTRGTKFHND